MPTYLISEIQAYAILHPDGQTTTEPADYHEAGNQIIAFAERIKAERAVAAMERI